MSEPPYSVADLFSRHLRADRRIQEAMDRLIDKELQIRFEAAQRWDGGRFEQWSDSVDYQRLFAIVSAWTDQELPHRLRERKNRMTARVLYHGLDLIGMMLSDAEGGLMQQIESAATDHELSLLSLHVGSASGQPEQRLPPFGESDPSKEQT